MTEDSTELTFVRCPACRSLVPAMSKRCRMCGAGLDSAPREDHAHESNKSARVRQRTMSTPGDMLNATVGELRSSLDGGVQDSSQLDPLDSSTTSSETQDSNQDNANIDQWSSGSGDREVSFEDPLGAYVEELPIEEVAAPEAPHEHIDRTADTHVNGRASTSKVHVESDVDVGVAAPQVVNPAVRQRESATEVSSGVSSAGEPLAKPSQRVPPKAESTEAIKFAAKPKAVAVPKKRGRLFGWLVDYRNSDGEAIEIREGKFFVTRSSLKELDLVLDEESISTPHAVVRASVESGLEVQDLMSDKGVFFKTKSDSDFEKKEERFAIKHGDWVKFGDVEYLVALIADVGGTKTKKGSS